MKNLKKSILALALASMSMVPGSATSVSTVVPESNTQVETEVKPTFVEKIISTDSTAPAPTPVSSSVQSVGQSQASVSTPVVVVNVNDATVAPQKKQVGFNNYVGGTLGIIGSIAAAFGVYKSVQMFRIGRNANPSEELKGSIKKFGEFFVGKESAEIAKSTIITAYLAACGVGAAASGVLAAIGGKYAYDCFTGERNPDLVELFKVADKILDKSL